MGLREKRFIRRPTHRQQKRLIVIATEGKKTEPDYFKWVRRFKETRNSDFSIKILPCKSGESSPKKVLRRLMNDLKKEGRDKADSAWLVIDRDSWSEEELREVIVNSRNRNINVALSIPCFELWLYLHLKDVRPFTNSRECKAALKDILRTERIKSFYEANPEDKISLAIRRAKTLGNPSEYRLEKTGTSVYLLMQDILKS